MCRVSARRSRRCAPRSSGRCAAVTADLRQRLHAEGGGRCAESRRRMQDRWGWRDRREPRARLLWARANRVVGSGRRPSGSVPRGSSATTCPGAVTGWRRTRRASARRSRRPAPGSTGRCAAATARPTATTACGRRRAWRATTRASARRGHGGTGARRAAGTSATCVTASPGSPATAACSVSTTPVNAGWRTARASARPSPGLRQDFRPVCGCDGKTYATTACGNRRRGQGPRRRLPALVGAPHQGAVELRSESKQTPGRLRVVPARGYQEGGLAQPGCSRPIASNSVCRAGRRAARSSSSSGPRGSGPAAVRRPAGGAPPCSAASSGRRTGRWPSRSCRR